MTPAAAQPTPSSQMPPSIGVLRHLARSGGTVISKCIACMRGVALLSEVHPAEFMRHTRPLVQAMHWHGLVRDDDVQRWQRAGRIDLGEELATIARRARERGDTLVLRDWSHLDYVGVPYAVPRMGFALGDALAGVASVRAFATVRHPIDQWLSLSRLPHVADRLTLSAYLRGLDAFSAWCVAHGFVRYEDFTREPGLQLDRICAGLGIAYDETWCDRWSAYDKVTGDRPGAGASGRGAASSAITPLERRAHGADLLDAFRSHDVYAPICERLGYEP
ncbi:MAG: hypothetical protein AAFP26_04645 [Planctomycetota bacterium]